MNLEEFIDDFERDDAAERRRLAAEKSYAITDHLAAVEEQLEATLQGGSLFGSTAPDIFVGRSGYPSVSAGVLSPVDPDTDASQYVTSSAWYERGLSIDSVFQARSGLLNASRPTNVHVADAWDGFTGVRREVAIADRPVDVEVELADRPTVDLSVDSIASPSGPRATADDAHLAENPHVPRPVEKTLSDDDWRATGAMCYLYNRGFDVYDINTILSAGALGQTRQRKLVPTRWSITAVDDTVSQYLRGQIRNATAVDQTEVRYAEFLGNQFWVVLTPGQWEFELVELKAPDSVWNPSGDDYYIGADHEGFEGRTSYVDETAGAYYAARLGVLESLVDRDRQATVLVVRNVTDEYWGPVGVWLIRETVRDAVSNDPAIASSFDSAVTQIATQLPISHGLLRRNSALTTGRQTTLAAFDR